jgi:hypothetical protein
MSALRLLVAGSLAVSLAAAGGALAAPAPVCNLITDPTGDTTGPSTALDIVSGDVANDAKTFTGVIRTAALSETDLSSPTGIAWGMRFSAPKSELPIYLLATKFQGSAVEFTFGEVDGTSLVEKGTGTGVIDVAKKEVRIHVPTKALGLKAGTKLTDLTAQGRRAIGASGIAAYSNADASSVDNAKPYTTNAASCVKPGA